MSPEDEDIGSISLFPVDQLLSLVEALSSHTFHLQWPPKGKYSVTWQSLMHATGYPKAGAAPTKWLFVLALNMWEGLGGH